MRPKRPFSFPETNLLKISRWCYVSIFYCSKINGRNSRTRDDVNDWPLPNKIPDCAHATDLRLLTRAVFSCLAFRVDVAGDLNQEISFLVDVLSTSLARSHSGSSVRMGGQKTKLKEDFITRVQYKTFSTWMCRRSTVASGTTTWCGQEKMLFDAW